LNAPTSACNLGKIGFAITPVKGKFFITGWLHKSSPKLNNSRPLDALKNLDISRWTMTSTFLSCKIFQQDVEFLSGKQAIKKEIVSHAFILFCTNAVYKPILMNRLRSG